MTWVTGHIGSEGNERPDHLAIDVTTNKTVKKHFVPVPIYLEKRKTYKIIYTDWQAVWNEAQTSTCTKKYFRR